MNRAERRKNKLSAEKPKTYVLTEDQINKMKRDAINEATFKAFMMFMSVPVMVLHDKFGFGESRLSRFMDYVLVWYESVQNGETPLTELVKVAEKECGIHITGRNNNGLQKNKNR